MYGSAITFYEEVDESEHPLTEEQKQLLVEQNKVREANLALAVQQERMKQLPAFPGGGKGSRKLVRHNTWNGGASGW